MKRKIFLAFETMGYELSCFEYDKKESKIVDVEFFPLDFSNKKENDLKSISLSIIENMKNFLGNLNLKISEFTAIYQGFDIVYKSTDILKKTNKKEIYRYINDELEQLYSREEIKSNIYYEIKKSDDGFIKIGFFNFPSKDLQIIKNIEKYGKYTCKSIYVNFQIVQCILNNFYNKENKKLTNYHSSALVEKSKHLISMTIIEFRNKDSIIYSIKNGIIENVMIVEIDNYSSGIINYLKEQDDLTVFGKIDNQVFKDILFCFENLYVVDKSRYFILEYILEKSFYNKNDIVYISKFSSEMYFKLAPINILKKIKIKDNEIYKLFYKITMFILLILLIELMFAYKSNVKLLNTVEEKNNILRKHKTIKNRSLSIHKNIYGVDVDKIISYINFLNGSIIKINSEYGERCNIEFILYDTNKLNSIFENNLFDKVDIVSVNFEEFEESFEEKKTDLSDEKISEQKKTIKIARVIIDIPQ